MYIGIDVGGTNLVAGVVSAEGVILAKSRKPTDTSKDAAGIIADCLEIAREACKIAGVAEGDIKSIGFGFPGTVDQEAGEVVFCCNIPFVNVPVAQIVKAAWDVPVYLENDADAAALGEAIAGSAKGHKNVLFITLGTGVGGGVIIDGKIRSGFNHAGGELGHMVIMHGGRQCGCGRKGCWEAYASATALIDYTREAMNGNGSSLLWNEAPTLDEVDGRTAFNAARKGDAAAQAVVERYIEMVACGLTNMQNILQPEVVCIGGGIANEGDYLIKPLTELVMRDEYNRTARKTVIRAASLGNDAGVIGAALTGR